MLHKWKSKFEFCSFNFWNFQTNLEVHGSSTIWHVVVHTCAKFGLIWAMLAETIVPKHHNGVNEHDRCTSFLVSYLVGCLRIIVSSKLLFFMDIIIWHKDSIGEGFKRFWYFDFFMNFRRFGQTTVYQSLWLVHELLESYKWFSVVTLWCSISPRCPFLVCKRHFGRCFTNGSLNLSFFM